MALSAQTGYIMPQQYEMNKALGGDANTARWL